MGHMAERSVGTGERRIKLLLGGKPFPVQPVEPSTPTTGVRPVPFHTPIKSGSHKPFAFNRAQRGNR